MSDEIIPNESQVRQAIPQRLSAELQNAKNLLQFGVNLPTSKDLHECGLPHDTVVTAVALFVKASLSFRGVIALCQVGLDRSAMPVSRSLFETALNLVFLIRRRVSLHYFNDSKKKPKTPLPLFGKKLTPAFRTALYNAWCVLREEKSIAAWQSTPGLKRHGKRIAKNLVALDRPYVDEIGTAWEERIKGANTCAGLSIENFAASLSPHLRKWYRTIYSEDSRSVHQSDMLNYLDADESSGTFSPRWFTSPKDVSAALLRASTIYLCCVEEMDKRFAFGLQAKEQFKQHGAVLRNWPKRE